MYIIIMCPFNVRALVETTTTTTKKTTTVAVGSCVWGSHFHPALTPLFFVQLTHTQSPAHPHTHTTPSTARRPTIVCGGMKIFFVLFLGGEV